MISHIGLIVDADVYGTARIVATVITAAAALLALPLLIAALRSSSGRAPQPPSVSDAREPLPAQVTERLEATPRVRADLATEGQPPVATTPVVAGDDIVSMRRRVDEHEAELARLREQLEKTARQPAPQDARQHTPNGIRP